ncbi:hypothetical protein H5T87_09005 [bacterium]|nr:hypothetical protein [bacterium]
MDQCSVCGVYQEEGAHLVSVSDGGAGGLFGHFENGQFKEGWENYPTAYKCPNNPQVVTLSFTVDDDGTLADDPPNTREVKITVWDFTITDCQSDWIPVYSTNLSFQLEIKPIVDHNGASLASTITCSISSSSEPGICMNKKIVPEDEYYWDLQFKDPQENFNISSSDPTQPKKRDRAVSTQPLTDATIVVNCYDFGAYGNLQAVANLPNIGMKYARVKRGQVVTDKMAVRIPLDDDNNYISDAWFSNQGQAGDDNDNIPAGDYPGDGLTRYEEYRLFHLKEGGIRLDPEKKDVFIFDDANIGVGDFVNTGLEIHLWSSLASREGTLVNIYRKTATKGPQYGIWTMESDEERKIDDHWIYGQCPQPWLNSPNVHIILFKGSIEAAVQELHLTLEQKEALIRSVIGHELGHAVNLTHCLLSDCIMYSMVNERNPNHIFCDDCKKKINLTKVQ